MTFVAIVDDEEKTIEVVAGKERKVWRAGQAFKADFTERARRFYQKQVTIQDVDAPVIMAALKTCKEWEAIEHYMNFMSASQRLKRKLHYVSAEQRLARQYDKYINVRSRDIARLGDVFGAELNATSDIWFPQLSDYPEYMAKKGRAEEVLKFIQDLDWKYRQPRRLVATFPCLRPLISFDRKYVTNARPYDDISEDVKVEIARMRMEGLFDVQ